MAFQDKIGANDLVVAGVSTTAVSSAFPCPKCGKESKEHHLDELERPRRICSDRSCRYQGLAGAFMGIRS